MPVADREYYERQGAAALEAGGSLPCSELTIVKAVIDMALAHIHEFKVVLDVGCGANLDYDAAIANEGKSVVGVDFTLNFLRLAPKRASVSIAQADALRLPFRNSSFDAVICSETAEHIPDDCALVAEIARVLKRNALLFFTAPNLWNAARITTMLRTRDLTIRMMEGHVREYSPAMVRTLLSPWFLVYPPIPVGFGWTGRIGGKIEVLIRSGILSRLSKSIAVVARKR